jgi:hypothetical protein
MLSASLDLNAFVAAPLARDPFPHVILPGFVKSEALAALEREFPAIDQPGSFPLSGFRLGPVFRAFAAELEGPAFRDLVAQKFCISLKGRPTMLTVRGWTGLADGRIHCDAKSKLITILIYMNSRWTGAGGRLRLLRSPDDLDDMVAEVPPEAGTLLGFQVTENSWHGHHPFQGHRRSLQLNWVTDQSVKRRELARHKLSMWTKRLNPFHPSGLPPS